MTEQAPNVQATQVDQVQSTAQPPGTEEKAPLSDKERLIGGVSTMEDLRKKEPKVYRATLEGIARQIISAMRRHQARLVKLMKEGQRNN